MKFSTFPILIALGLLIMPTLAGADEITLLADPWCPYTCDAASARQGYMIDIARKVFSKAGHTVKYINLDWDSAVAETKTGKYNAIVGAYVEDAPDFVFPKESCGFSGNVFFVRKDSAWQYKDVASLAKVKVGIVKGYSYGDILDGILAEKRKAGEIVEGEGLAPLDLLVAKLLKGEIDVIIEDVLVLGDYFVTKMPDRIGAVKKAGQEGAPEPIYVAFSPAHPKSGEYADLLANGLEALRKSGELAPILHVYHLKDWK